MSKPSRGAWNTMMRCLNDYHEHLAEHEPYATATLNAIATILDESPTDVDEAFASNGTEEDDDE